MRAYKVTQGLRDNDETTMAVPKPNYYKQTFHLISSKRYHELQVNIFLAISIFV